MFKLPENTLTRFSLLFATLSLAACGGGGSSSTSVVSQENTGGETPEDTSSGSDDFAGTQVQDYFVGENATLKAGVFLGQVSYTNDTPPVDGFMLLSPTGNFTFVLDTESVTSLDVNIISGTLTLDGLDIEGSLVEYELFKGSWNRSTGSLKVPSSVTPGESPSALLYTGGIVDKVEITRNDDASDQSLDFAEIADGTGIYRSTGSDSQITIDTAGGITGFDRGCELKGQITIPTDEVNIPDADINIFELSYEASGCDDLAEAPSSQRNGEYLGVGTFTPTNSEGEERIEFAASNGKIAFYFAGAK